MKEQLLQAIVTVLSLVNPAICGAMFAQIETNHSPGQQAADATKAVLATMVILAISALVGTQLLHLFGVSLDAFMVAGGGVLAWMGFSMLSGQATSPTSDSALTSRGPSLTPLVLFAASPGTITGVITLSAAHTGLDLPVTALVAIAVAPGKEFTLLGDVGGFGAGSEFSWQAVATYGFDVNCLGTPLHTGYRLPRACRRFQRRRSVRQECPRRGAARAGHGRDIQLVMSALGQKPTFAGREAMSAKGQKRTRAKGGSRNLGLTPQSHDPIGRFTPGRPRHRPARCRRHGSRCL